MSDLFQDQLHINAGIRPGGRYFLKCLRVILISSQHGELLATEVFPVKKVQLLAETQGWEWRSLSLSFTKKPTPSTASTPALLFPPAILFKLLRVRLHLGQSTLYCGFLMQALLARVVATPSFFAASSLTLMTASSGSHSISPECPFPVSFMCPSSFVLP